MAGADLAAAAQHAGQCTAQQGALAAAWKLLGDVHLQHHSVTPASAAGQDPSQKYVPRGPVHCCRAARCLGPL